VAWAFQPMSETDRKLAYAPSAHYPLEL
jgi:hypothetical protein